MFALFIAPISLKLLRSLQIKHPYFMHFMLILQACMMSNPSLSYVDHIGMLPNNNCSLKCAITCVHTNTFSHSSKCINSPQSTISLCRKKKKKKRPILDSCGLRSNEIKFLLPFYPCDKHFALETLITFDTAQFSK